MNRPDPEFLLLVAGWLSELLELNMSSACGRARAWIAAVIASGLWASIALMAAAQAPVWSVPSYGVYPRGAAGVGPAGIVANHLPTNAAAGVRQQAPLARVVRNPDDSSGLPPYALTDNAGTIQRYVEPVPGIDLEPYVGTVVRVRHDTGRTLLASQLELPPQPPQPLAEASGGEVIRASSSVAARPVRTSRPASPARIVHPVDFVDDDDATVQLLADTEETLPDGGDVSPPEGAVQAEPMDTEGRDPSFPEGMSLEGDPMYGEPLDMGPGGMEMGGPLEMGGPMEMGMPGMEFGGGMGEPMEVCPRCGGYHFPPGYGDAYGEGRGPACRSDPQPSRFFADVQFNFLRAHVMENLAGKLSEKYEFSPRVIVGFDGTGKVDGRARFWHYGRDTRILDNGGAIRIDFDVLDIEATRTVALGNSDFTFAAGFRSASIDLDDDDGDSAGCDLLGMTVAADFNTLLCPAKRGEFVGVCGARFSLLGGDWGQDGGSDFIPAQLQDDNVVVDELYAGVGFETCYRSLDLHAQLRFEMQNWHSDVLSQFAGADSIGFIGPGIEIGAEF